MSRVSTSRAATLAFLTAFVTLVAQVLVHRVVAAKLLNNLAFLVISLTMLGFAISGVILARFLGSFLARFSGAMCACAALFVLSLLGVTVAFYHADVGPQSPAFGRFFLDFLGWLPLALLYAVPFTFCGLMLGALLSAPGLPTSRIYFADLVGSGVGAFAVIAAIQDIGVEASLLAVSGLLLAATVVLMPPRETWARGAVALGAAGLLVCVAVRGRAFEMRYPGGSILAAASTPGTGYAIEHTRWDPVARIEVSRIPPPDPAWHNYPSLIGNDRDFLARFRRMLTQNNYAFTYAVDYDGRPESLRGIDQTIYSAAYQASAVRRPRVLVIGVGGGFDILSALFFDAAHVTGVEINAATIEILTRTDRDYFRPWVDDPRVELVAGEGRHHLATHEDRYDVLQLSGVDSYSGTAAAAHVFSENYLYTAEAFDLYLRRLTPDGILNMMRLEFEPPREMLRGLVTASGALRRLGVARPADHIVMLTATPNRNFTALLVKRTPFTVQEVGRVRGWAATSPFFALAAAPGLNERGENLYQSFLTMGTPEREAAFVAAYPFDISAVDDNRPFFFRYSFWRHLFTADPVVRNTSFPFLEHSLLALVMLVGATSIACVYLPLHALARKGMRTPHFGRHTVYFAGAGLGYMACEIALLQRFGLFLGHPNYALSVVLASLLVASGLGSLWSGSIGRRLGAPRFAAYALCVVVLAEYAFALPRLPALVGLPFPAKVAIAAALIAPIGVLLGTFLPRALELLKRENPHLVPWAWGVNGIFSVMAPILSVGFSMSWGINALLLAALPIYLATGWSFVEPVAEPEGSALPAAS